MNKYFGPCVNFDIDLKFLDSTGHRHFIVPLSTTSSLKKSFTQFSNFTGKLDFFSDEKSFSIEQAHNIQNDRVLSPVASAANKNGRVISCTQKLAGVMVWDGVSNSSKTELIFVEKGIKINTSNHISNILESVVAPWTKQTYPNELWICQQDSAPAHRAKKTQTFCEENFPDFITSHESPPYSPDLNPLDYVIWGILQAKACSKPHTSVRSLKCDLKWNEISQEMVFAVINQFPRRLRACIKEKG